MIGNKKIAVNSVILFLRLVVTTVIGLYTSRVVLIQLGAKDYGLYVVVGGIVTMMSFLNITMLTTTYRFLAVELGKTEKGYPNKVFNTSLVIHIMLSIVLIIISETVGIWYIKAHLNIISEKIPDAIFVLHFTVLATAFNILSVPFQGLITAKENFIVRALIEILRAVIKLILVFFLIEYLGNKLRAYSIIMAIAMVVPSTSFILYCYINYWEVVKIKINKKIDDYIEMLKFSGWILLGAIAHISVRQGAALIINIFFGTALNAAFGIASQVYNYIMMFVRNLNQAAVPQIMKSQSGGDSKRSLELVYSISKYAFFMMMLPSVPILLSINSILVIWLKKVPNYTKEFVVLMIVNGLIGVLASGFDAVIQATGNIRKNQIFYSVIMISTLPLSYILYKLNFAPYFITVATILATFSYLIVQIFILKEITDFNFYDYWRRTLFPVFLVLLFVIPQFILNYFIDDSRDVGSVIMFSFISILLTIVSIFLIGLNRREKQVIFNLISKVRQKI